MRIVARIKVKVEVGSNRGNSNRRRSKTVAKGIEIYELESKLKKVFKSCLAHDVTVEFYWLDQ